MNSVLGFLLSHQGAACTPLVTKAKTAFFTCRGAANTTKLELMGIRLSQRGDFMKEAHTHLVGSWGLWRM